MRTAAILPVKRFDRAKSRLGASVADALRGELARAMVADVLRALARTASIRRTIVVTSEPSLQQTASQHGALLVPDGDELGQSAAVTLGVRRALADGIERVLCIPGDCPALDPTELDALLTAERDSDPSGAGGPTQVVIVPDRHGTGTNGLLLTPPDAIAPSFGPDSCERHRALALAAGMSCRVERLPSLLLDIDTGADLAALRERLSDGDAAAVRTRAVLSQDERPSILSIVSSD
jgi:2-phospho-L-lactate/phosphoenolpyruvate guanylyltransferase